MFKDSKAFSSFAVADVEAARGFYEKTLGLEISDGWMEGLLELSIGGASVMVYPKPDHVPATFTVLNFPVDDIEKAVDDLSGLGVTFEQYDQAEIKTDARGIARDPAGPAIAWFKDPSGNILSIVQIS